jgi:hypothetical protein
VDESPCIVFGAVEGRESVTRRWSVTPAAREARFERAKFKPMTDCEARTDEVVPLQLYVNAGETPLSVQGTEQRSIVI